MSKSPSQLARNAVARGYPPRQSQQGVVYGTSKSVESPFQNTYEVIRDQDRAYERAMPANQRRLMRLMRLQKEVMPVHYHSCPSGFRAYQDPSVESIKKNAQETGLLWTTGDNKNPKYCLKPDLVQDETPVPFDTQDLSPQEVNDRLRQMTTELKMSLPQGAKLRQRIIEQNDRQEDMKKQRLEALNKVEQEEERMQKRELQDIFHHMDTSYFGKGTASVLADRFLSQSNEAVRINRSGNVMNSCSTSPINQYRDKDGVLHDFHDSFQKGKFMYEVVKRIIARRRVGWENDGAVKDDGLAIRNTFNTTVKNLNTNFERLSIDSLNNDATVNASLRFVNGDRFRNPTGAAANVIISPDDFRTNFKSPAERFTILQGLRYIILNLDKYQLINQEERSADDQYWAYNRRERYRVFDSDSNSTTALHDPTNIGPPFCIPSMLANLLTNPDVYAWQPATDKLSRWLATAYRRSVARTAIDYNGMYAPTTGATYKNAIDSALQESLRESAMKNARSVGNLRNLGTGVQNFSRNLRDASERSAKHHGGKNYRSGGRSSDLASLDSYVLSSKSRSGRKRSRSGKKKRSRSRSGKKRSRSRSRSRK